MNNDASLTPSAIPDLLTLADILEQPLRPGGTAPHAPPRATPLFRVQYNTILNKRR